MKSTIQFCLALAALSVPEAMGVQLDAGDDLGADMDIYTENEFIEVNAEVNENLDAITI